MKKLSILICTLIKRERFLKRLQNLLAPQITNDVEVLIEKDNGELSIGAKRNILLQKASSEFLCYIDDDDRVDSKYIEKILNAIETKPDCVGMEGIITFDGKRPQKFIHSIKYDSWFEKGGIYYRCCNHLNPIKHELALLAKFPETNHGEDKSFSDQMKIHLKNEVYINGPIYFYDFVNNK